MLSKRISIEFHYFEEKKPNESILLSTLKQHNAAHSETEILTISFPRTKKTSRQESY